jgi:hypothetical protein
LRHVAGMAGSTHVDRHGLRQVHARQANNSWHDRSRNDTSDSYCIPAASPVKCDPKPSFAVRVRGEETALGGTLATIGTVARAKFGGSLRTVERRPRPADTTGRSQP